MMDALSGLGMIGVLLVVLAALVLLAALVVLVGRRGRQHASHGTVPGHRLAVVDQVPIDETRRLVLIQRDDVQHLVILGGGGDFLVESGIGAARQPAVETHPVERPAAPVPPARPSAAIPAAPEAVRPAPAPRAPRLDVAPEAPARRPLPPVTGGAR